MMNYINCISYLSLSLSLTLCLCLSLSSQLHNKLFNSSFLSYTLLHDSILLFSLYLCYFLQQQKIYILLLLFYFSPLPNIYTQKPARFFKIHELTIKMIEKMCLVIILLLSFPLLSFDPVKACSLVLSFIIILIIIHILSSLARFYICKKLKSTTTTHSHIYFGYKKN